MHEPSVCAPAPPVCPSAFDLGDGRKVAILSVTASVDKPIPYPDMFMAAEPMILSRIDPPRRRRVEAGMGAGLDRIAQAYPLARRVEVDVHGR